MIRGDGSTMIGKVASTFLPAPSSLPFFHCSQRTGNLPNSLQTPPGISSDSPCPAHHPFPISYFLFPVPCFPHLTRIPSFRISLRNICRIAACQSIHSSASRFFASFFARAVSRAFSRSALSMAARSSSDPSRGASA